jgi:hypothetical protein
MLTRTPLRCLGLALMIAGAAPAPANAQAAKQSAAKHYTIDVTGGNPFRDGLFAIVGQRHQIVATLVKNGKKAKPGAFEWVSANPAVAAVADGLVEARSYGTAEIIVTEVSTGASRTIPLVVSADQYFWTADLDELNTLLAENAGLYEYDRVAFDVILTEDAPGLVPLWRFLETTTITHFWTTDPDGEQFLPPYSSLPGLREGAAAQIYPTPAEGTVPVYRWNNLATGVHFWSTDPAGESFGPYAVLEGIAFYALPAESGFAGALPMYRARCVVCH